MKSGIVAGALAGVVGGIVSVIFGMIGGVLGLFGAPPDPIINFVVLLIVLPIIFGAIFGGVFSKLYDPIPGTGVLKGLYFGLIIWLIKDIFGSVELALLFKEASIAIALLFVGFFGWIAYGSVLGALYKK
jgi:hypothetical protein